jgi:flagellar hook-associated protein 3 FlgL
MIKEKIQPFSFNATTGYYEFDGDEGQKFLQISPSVALASNDSGKNIFEETIKK